MKLSSSKPTLALVTNDVIGERMAGPGIRYWEFARILGRHFPVKLIVPPVISMPNVPQPEKLAPFVHICSQLEDFQSTIDDCDVIITLGVILYFYPFLAELGKPLVLDLYNPFLIENLQREFESDFSKQLSSYESFLAALRVQLLAGDFFICAGEKQRDYWLGTLSALGRVNPYTYRYDPTLRRLIDVAPFGLPAEAPQHTKMVLKGVYKTITPTDKVIIWGGGIWNWFDAPTMIKAMPLILKQRSDVKLFFMGVRRPNQDAATTRAVEQAVALAQELGLYNASIFFNDWVPYEERQNYLLEADIGVSLHLGFLETRFAFRTRFLDYVWTGLPVVATEGDVLSDTLAAQNLAHLVAPGDTEGVARTILSLLEHPNLRAGYVERFRQVAAQYQWEVVARPLLEFCANPAVAPDKAYLSQTSFSRNRQNANLSLLQKGWRVWQMDGVSGLLRQSRDYMRWKLSKHQKL
ncbi:MAG: glycosyltransferase family 4 protein [Anaerolineae bacterium]